MRFYWERVEASRNFANKVWNASRFIMMNMPEAGIDLSTVPTKLTDADKWILSKANTLAKDVTDNLDKYEIGIAATRFISLSGKNFVIGILKWLSLVFIMTKMIQECSIMDT